MDASASASTNARSCDLLLLALLALILAVIICFASRTRNRKTSVTTYSHDDTTSIQAHDDRTTNPPPLTNHSLHLCRPVVYKYKKIPSYHNVARPKTVRSIAGNLERLLDARFVPQEVCWTIMKGTWKLAQYAVSGTALSGFVVIDLDYTTGLNIGFDNGEEDARRGKDDGSHTQSTNLLLQMNAAMETLPCSHWLTNRVEVSHGGTWNAFGHLHAVSVLARAIRFTFEVAMNALYSQACNQSQKVTYRAREACGRLLSLLRNAVEVAAVRRHSTDRVTIGDYHVVA
ncbi:hypothetical protein DOTSEDRAFT_79266 [Dothistroma septosporum NZE10]|uniref:Uncharacterized protein n=1 Tax=Dothistroma septosporum (strain NZE10 / CBS 128990) TaxID=675120 RepID=N1PP58_DOTSN|nr:hypothetical protein DOTSEDRAFT_79266 [Dothistroma septosporum NZE10]